MASQLFTAGSDDNSDAATMRGITIGTLALVAAAVALVS
jgi:hypothetical protein